MVTGLELVVMVRGAMVGREEEKRARRPASVRERELGVTGASCSPSIVIPWEASSFRASSYESSLFRVHLLISDWLKLM